MTKNDKLRHHKRRVNVHQIFFFIIFYLFLEQIRQHPN